MVDQESYTPPPWVFWCADTDCEEDNCTQTAHNGRFLIGTHAGGIHAEVTSGLADTRLMTAAPELLDALQVLRKDTGREEWPCWCLSLDTGHSGPCIAARVAYAKATGHD